MYRPAALHLSIIGFEHFVTIFTSLFRVVLFFLCFLSLSLADTANGGAYEFADTLQRTSSHSSFLFIVFTCAPLRHFQLIKPMRHRIFAARTQFSVMRPVFLVLGNLGSHERVPMLSHARF